MIGKLKVGVGPHPAETPFLFDAQRMLVARRAARHDSKRKIARVTGQDGEAKRST